MKILIRISLFLVLFVSFSACDNEPVNDIAKIEKELKKVVKDNEITKCSVFVYDSDLSPKLVSSNTDFSIKNGTLVIIADHVSGGKYEQRYNLLYLSKYEFADGYIYLYFSNIYK